MADQFRAANGKLYVATSGVVPNSVDTVPTISISDANTKIKYTAFDYLYLNDKLTAAAATGIALGSAAGTITSGKYASMRLQISPSTATVQCTIKSSAHTTQAQALADIPDVTANWLSLGYFTIKAAASTDFTCGTSSLRTSAPGGGFGQIQFFEEFDRAYVGDFQGNMVFNLTGEDIVWNGQDVAPKGSEMISIGAQATIGEMIFRPNSLVKMWGATYDPLSTMKGGSNTDDISWTIKSTLRPVELELLFAFTDTATNKKCQVWCPRAKSMAFPINLGAKTWTIHDMTWDLYSDTSDDFWKYFREK